MTSTVEKRLARMGLELPPVPNPVGLFRLGKVEGDLLFLSGQGPLMEDGRLATGKVGRNVNEDEARHHAQRTGLVLIAAAKAVVGDLERVSGPVKLLGLVNATEDFDRHPYVIDGCSVLLHELWGEDGGHARSSIGVSSLPGGITVEIEAIFRLTR